MITERIELHFVLLPLHYIIALEIMLLPLLIEQL